MTDTCSKPARLGDETSGLVTVRKMEVDKGTTGLWSIQNWPIKIKIPFISFLGVALILVVTVAFFLPYVESRVIESEQKATMQTVDVVFGILEHFNQLELNGVYGRDEAISHARQLIKQLRYRQGDYFWLLDESSQMVLHPLQPNLEGKHLADIESASDRLFYEESLHVALNRSSGFVEHQLTQPDDDTVKMTQSYVKRFKPWGWIVGSDIDLAEVDRVVTGLRLITLAMAAFFAIVTMLVAYLIGQGITHRLIRVIAGLKDVAQGRGHINQSHCMPITSADEIGTLSFEFNVLMDSIKDLGCFRKLIEEDETCSEVYSRLWDVFTDIGLKDAVIYEVDESHNLMKAAYPHQLQASDLHCSPDILDQCGLCKAKRTGHTISSLAFHKVCKQFLHLDEAMEYVCIPMSVGGGIIGVVQFIFDERIKVLDRDLLAKQVDKASQFIKEALPVIESKRLTATLRASTLVDPMTGLHNRRFLQECANNLCSGSQRRGKKIGLLMCDLDFFKQVNDTYGHDVGDSVLKITSEILQNSVRQSDLVVRFGGEEFIIILVDIESDEVMGLAEKIRKQIEATEFPVPGKPPLKKTISIGISVYPDDEDGFWKTLKYADVALYKAKENGRNQSVRFTKEMWEGQEY
ncbi:diguanylate cyclase [Magnetococcus marinus MC-1]|uniref:diguanylate cyclase n=1 Tax=Magnetococcus marinus (strain ATCC BAA-1437 / JCM 17883 / MC-1) TaxID=156889 RepID=A0L6R6_MAGMM|nr:diguanylate cyclase [Magnetococcus marinus]ABK43659.1 diguanylate cyclase [Magnetococcus marinus MC-1]